MFVDMAANQTRLGSANISRATLRNTHQRTFFTHRRRIPDHWNPFEVMIVFQMFGKISNTRWGGGGFLTLSTYMKHMKDVKPPGKRFVSLRC